MASSVTDPGFTFYTTFFNKIDSLLNTYVSTTSSNVITGFAGTATTLLSIYVALWGWMMLRGTIREPLMDGLQRIIKISLIWGFAMSVATYQSQIANVVFAMPADAATLITPGSSPANAMSSLDTDEDNVYMAYENEVAQAYIDSSFKIPNIGELFLAIIILLVGSLMVLYGAFLYVLSLIALAVLLGVGPLFILGLLFDATKPFFEKWIGMLFHYVFVVMLTAAVLSIILSVVDSYIMAANATPAGSTSGNFTSAAFPVIIIGIIGALVLTQVQTKASALSGGIALATMGAFAAAGRMMKNGAWNTVNARRNHTKWRMENRRLDRFRRANPGAMTRTARWAAAKINPNTIKKS